MSRGCRTASPALFLSTESSLLVHRQSTPYPQHICTFEMVPSNILYFLIDFQNSLCYTQAHSQGFPFKLDPRHLS